jgi:hypothetical protein
LSIGTLGFYLLERYQIKNDIWPEFSKRKEWYDLYLFPLGTNSSKVRVFF